MKTRTPSMFVAAAVLGLGLPSPVSAAFIISMPPGTRAEINISTEEALAAQLASPSVPLAIPEATYLNSGGFPVLTASVAATASTQKASLFGGGEAYIGVNDTYTVGGSAVGSFLITMTLHVTGTYGTIPVTNGFKNVLAFESLQLEIGTFHPEAMANQFIVDPFLPDANNPATVQKLQSHGAVTSPGGPVSFDLDEQLSYTKLVQVGDVFDIGYDVIANIRSGQMDLTHTGTVSFALPEGVFLDSALGAHFGEAPTSSVPEPSSLALAVCGVFGLAVGRRRRMGRRSRPLSPSVSPIC